MANNPNVVVDAKMSDEQLLRSIDATLTRSEKKFTDFATGINATLGKIGEGFGKGMSNSFNTQVDAMSKKIKELEAQIKSVDGKKATTPSATPTVSTININDLDKATISAKELAKAFSQADKSIASINDKLSNLNVAKQETTEEQVNIEILKRQKYLEQEKVLRAQIVNESQKAAKAESLSRIGTGGQSYTSAMAMEANSIQQRIEKIKALEMVQRNLSISETGYNAKLASTNREIMTLKNANKDALASGIQLEKANNKLATSFENLGRRVLFYTGLGAMTGFVRQLYTIRGEYEMLERSMGALLGDFSKGSELFNQIQAQALKSPLTVIDLSTAAKQLVAYNYNLGEIADTTRRVADLSSALGVPIERLVYNLGQIKSKQVLDARDARDFANAGFAIVPMLAKMYTEQKRMGDQVVTTSQVYDMMTKKLVSYSDVMKVVNQATDKGGMFFDYQAKQAETLKGQLSNLTDAWNLMLNQMGEENQGVLTGTVSVTRKLLANWREIKTILTGLIVTYGAVKAWHLILNNAIGQNVIGLNKEILANKAKVASDLLRIKMTRNLTEVEEESLRKTKAVSAEDYAAALATKNLTKEQLMLKFALASKNSVVRQAIISNNMLTETEIAQATAMGRLPAIFRMISLGFKQLAASVGTFMMSMLPLLAVTAIITVVAKLINKWKEHQQQLEEINKQYGELRDKVVDISVNFKVANVGGNIDEMKVKLAELIAFAKEEFNIDIVINTDKLNGEEMVQQFTELRNKINLIMAKSQEFQENVTGKEAERFEDAGKKMDKVWKDIVGINDKVSNTLIDNLQGVKFSAFATSYVKSISQAQSAEESNIEYVNRLYESYKELGLVWDEFGDRYSTKLIDNMNKLGLATDKVSVKKMMDLGSSFRAAYNTINKVVPKIQKELEKADAKTLEDKKALIDNWVKTAKLTEMQRQILYDEFKIEFSVGPAKDLTNQLEGWKLAIQNYLEENPLKLTAKDGVVTLAPVNIDELLNKEGASLTSVQQQAKQDYDEAKAEYDALAGLKLQGLATDKEVSDQYLLMKKREYALGATGYKEKEKEEKQLSKIAQSIKDEIGLIENLTGSYDKLTKAGMSNKDALSLLNDEYKESISIINTTLSKYGLPQFDLANFAGKDVSGQLAYLEELKSTMKTKGLDTKKPDAYKEVNAQIEKITVDAKTYDLSRVTEGLQNSLSNIKESYELGLEIEADPELGNLFSDMFKIDPNSLIKTANDAINALQQAWDKQILNYNKLNPEKSIGTTDLMTTKPEDLAESLGLEDSSAIIKEYKDFYDYAHKIRLDDYKNSTKLWNDLLAKYSEYEYKKNEIQKTAATERLGLIQKFGTDEQYKQALDLSNQIQISQDPQVISNLQSQLKALTDSVTQGNAVAIPIATAITTKAGQETNKLDFEAFKNSDLYIKSFEDLGRVGTSTLDSLYDNLMKLSEDPNIEFQQLREITRQLKTIRDELQSRNPFDTIVKGLKAWKTAQDDLDTAKANNDIKAQAEAQDRLHAAQSDVKNGLESVNDAYGKFASLGNQVIDILKSMAEGLGITFDEKTTDIIEDISKALGIVSAAMGIFIAVEEIMAITTLELMAVLWPLLAVALALAAAFSIFNAKNRKIDRELERSEDVVANLDNAYKKLERTVEKSMGSAVMQAQKAMIANKKLQLAEAERQLALEKSRKKKKQDEGTISDLEGQIIDLKYEIEDLAENIANTLLGTDVKSAAEDFANTWIDAFLSGENAMDSLNNKFGDMIQNMIVQAIAGKVIMEKLQPLFDYITTAGGDNIITPDEIQKAIEIGGAAMEGIDTYLTSLTPLFEWVKNLKTSSVGDLSALQQGIQGISEDTGGAIEAYMNNLNGQVFKQGSILQEMLNISKVSLGGQSQMLLQMQQSYQVQMSMKSLMEGWTISSGRAIRVEMV